MQSNLSERFKEAPVVEEQVVEEPVAKPVGMKQIVWGVFLGMSAWSLASALVYFGIVLLIRWQVI